MVLDEEMNSLSIFISCKVGQFLSYVELESLVHSVELVCHNDSIAHMEG